MIYQAVSHVASELNAYINLRAPTLTPDRVVAESLFDLDGSASSTAKDKIVVLLVNVEQDRVYRPVDPLERAADGTAQFVRPDVNVNLFLLFIANLSDYGEALKAVAHVISFFQHRSVFMITDPDRDPDEQTRVSFELFTLTFEQQNHLWGAIGSKFMPCVMYKAGLLKVRDTQVEADIGPVHEILINE